MTPKIATFTTTPGPMTSFGDLDRLLFDAPRDIPGMVAFVQNLLLHVHWAPAFRMRLTETRQAEIHTRSVQDMLRLMERHDPRPLVSVRTLYQRAVGNCRHFSTFAVGLFRRAGIPARARCGFARYFDSKMAVDHWVVEYFNGCIWQRLDAQIDAAQRAMLSLEFDPLDVPADQFLTAGEAWVSCRTGRDVPQKFGIFDMHGLWFIAGNLVRDFASLNNMEMLPWDVWGVMPKNDGEITPEHGELFDRLATLTHDPDAHFDAIRALYRTMPGLAVPERVFNAMQQTVETVA